MHLKHPEILWALFLLLIPLIVHLFRLRRFKKETFTNVRFLREVEQQTRKSATLRKWLVLFTRLMGFTMLILAFSGPYLGNPNTGISNTSYIVYLDNSHSMSLPTPQGSLLQKAVNEILDQWPEDIPLQVVTNDRALGPGSKSELRNELLTLEHSNQQLDLKEILLKAQPLFTAGKNQSVLYLFTDLQGLKISEDPLKGNGIALRLNTLRPESPENIAIDSISMEKNSPESIDLTVFLSRSDDASEVVTPVSVFSGNDLLARGPAVFETDTATVRFTIPPEDLTKATVSITDNGLTYDNRLYFNVPFSQKIRVLRIAHIPAPYLERIYTSDEFVYSSVKPEAIDYNTLEDQNLVIIDQLPVLPPILNNSLSAVADGGTRILQIPAINEVLTSFAPLNRHLGLPLRDSLITTATLVNTINYDHPLLSGVFNERVTNFQYPEVQQFYRLKQYTSSALEIAGGLPFLYGNNGHYAFTAPIREDNTDLTQSALIVPLFYNIGLQSMRLPKPYYTMGSEGKVDIRTTLNEDQILSLDNGVATVIPRQEGYGKFVRVFPDDMTIQPGHYDVRKDEEGLGVLSMNLSRTESKLHYTNPEALENSLNFDSVNQGLEQVKSENKVNELWKWFVIFAIAFFLTEMLILKYFK